MHREVHFTVIPREPLIPETLPAQIARICGDSLVELPAMSAISFVVRNDFIDDLEIIRRWILEIRPLGVEESWRGYPNTTEEMKAHKAFIPMLSSLMSVTVNADTVFSQRLCANCRRPQFQVSTNGELILTVSSRKRLPHIFAVDSGLLILSRDVVGLLEAEQLVDGLGLQPIKMNRAAQQPSAYFAAYATIDLGWPAHPFGFVDRPCRICGGIRPRYAWYQSFEARATTGPWASARTFGPACPIVSAEVKDWIESNWAWVIGEANTGKSRPGFVPIGLDPLNRDLAFLSPSQQAILTPEDA